MKDFGHQSGLGREIPASLARDEALTTNSSDTNLALSQRPVQCVSDAGLP